ncbi:hypothetical protein G5714_003859 [Onychostoma macrolepis]|uniref:Uncharacterized protein n=1 Tax=Onychostoma macrolepis TaxID=369639 RepID=A0A7J6DAU2_9TELE|nr:hypothetical protein G5714_003859 [Onychostoma macrolepis]
MLKYVLGWISRSHEMNPSMKPGASKQTQRRMEGLSSWRDGPPFCLLFLVRSPAKCQLHPIRAPRGTHGFYSESAHQPYIQQRVILHQDGPDNLQKRLSVKLQESEKYEGTERRYFFSHFLHWESKIDRSDSSIYWLLESSQQKGIQGHRLALLAACAVGACNA